MKKQFVDLAKCVNDAAFFCPLTYAR